jgi:replicative DNA helicase
MVENIIKTSKLVEIMVENIQETYNQRKNPPFDIVSGINELDMILQGFNVGELNIIASRPSIGKTQLALYICSNMSSQGVKCLYVSFEKKEHELMKQMLSIGSHVSTTKLNTGFISQTDFQAVASAAESLYKNESLFIKSVYNTNIVALKDLIKNLIDDYNTKVVFIDYLTMIIPAQLYTNRWEQVSEISRYLKTIAMELNVCIIALCPLNRNAINNIPHISNLSESGSIEYDADKIILLDENKDRTQEIFEKNKNPYL